MTTIYRTITDDDSAQFCHRVTEALSRGWSLYGQPMMAFDAGRGMMRMGQAVTKEIHGEYHPDMKLGAQ